ncbi:arrestin domain-containing protein 1a [Salarias fasciatus]|uniref:Arrestin domain-containing protein 1-like n=1 Tax=Salarias fasciatus TaxID=181472 RepID=A0A672H3B9_SALFA|nr:arrestin domain-containing protein 1-like [Salarias fasciatus]
MGKLQEFSISFDKNKVVYSPGESISGTVTLKVNQALQCKAIKVNCNGFCGITTKVNDPTWTTEEQYFNSSVSVADKGTLKAGAHTFPFKFLIPATAPTSFEGNYGKIIYRVRAFIETPRFAKDYDAEKSFFLLSLLNLNEVPDIWGVRSSAITQQFSYMLMKTGTVVLKAQTDMRGYTPGQVIQVSAKIHNQSGKTTGKMAASLMQRVTYETKKPTHDLRTIAEVEGGVVKANKEVEWNDQIIVPPLPQSFLGGCELIKIEYYVKVSLNFPDVTLTLPIHIGNVSLDKRLQTANKAAASPAPPSAADAPATPDAAAATAAGTTIPPRPAPKPAARPTPRLRASSHNSPSAPPADYPDGAEPMMQDNRRQSQLVSPNAFSYAPGLFFGQNQQPPAAASTPGVTGLYPSLSTSSPMIVPQGPPPNYNTSSYPQEAPPPYDESCDT